LKGTNHTILFSKVVRDEMILEEWDPKETYVDSINHMVVQCKGCDHISFLMRHTGDSFTNEKGESEVFDINYPDTKFSAPLNMLTDDEIYVLPSVLQDLYDELQIVLKHDANILVGVGLRMLVEAICMEQNITGGNLKVKIEQLHKKGLLAENAIPILDKLRTIGNTSAHEIKAYSIDKLSYAVEIINHVLRNIYILPRINKKLKVDFKRKVAKKSIQKSKAH
jgi:hypothetical protein